MPKKGCSDAKKLHLPITVSVSWCKIPIALIDSNFSFDILLTFFLSKHHKSMDSEILGSLEKSVLVELVCKHWSTFGIVNFVYVQQVYQKRVHNIRFYKQISSQCYERDEAVLECQVT